jgi:C4-type Zn-finger protein
VIILLVTYELELCPKCGRGHNTNTTREVDPFRQTNSLQILICDYCGMKKSNVGTKI